MITVSILKYMKKIVKDQSPFRKLNVFLTVVSIFFVIVKNKFIINNYFVAFLGFFNSEQKETQKCQQYKHGAGKNCLN